MVVPETAAALPVMQLAPDSQHEPFAVPGRVTLPGRKNAGRYECVVPGMKPINDGHVAEPGLAVVEVAADDETAFAVQELLATRWAIAPADRTTHEPANQAYDCAATWTCSSSLRRRR
ncbi:DUF6207 family protein [Streptomyces sp. CNZ748]|uniref:DUF6207 family protein n=1 Tax=Streptomyces sp. CNZ748 TaxID=2885160 RepID=UPI001E3F0A86|nr:DUF6207 family protein [Streptomyces sp. CNZ748]